MQFRCVGPIQINIYADPYEKGRLTERLGIGLKNFIDDSGSQQLDFIGGPLEKKILIDEYVPYDQRRNYREKFQILDELTGFQHVRGDGNCFYSALSYQFLSDHTAYSRFRDLIAVLDLELFISQNNATSVNVLSPDLQRDIKAYYLDELEQLRYRDFVSQIQFFKDYPLIPEGKLRLPQEQSLIIKPINMQIEPQLDQGFNLQSFLEQWRSDYDSYKKFWEGKFYEYFRGSCPLFFQTTIILFRNIAYRAYREFRSYYQVYLSQDLREDILTLQKECNSNEVLIMMLCKLLNISITLYKIDRSKASREQYSPEGAAMLDIPLLFRPGHYQIGLK